MDSNVEYGSGSVCSYSISSSLLSVEDELSPDKPESIIFYKSKEPPLSVDFHKESRSLSEN